MSSRFKQIFIFIFIGSGLFSQSNNDSLKLALKSAKHDTSRCRILNILVETESDEVWPAYNERLLKTAESACNSNPPKKLLDIYLKYKACAINNMGVLANNNGDISKALIYYKKALMINEKINDQVGVAGSLNNLAFIYDQLGDIPRALEYYHKSLNINNKLDNKLVESTVLNNLGLIYKNQNEIERAIEYYTKSLKICEEINDVEGIGAALINIGSAYDELNNMQKTLDFYNRSLEVYKTNKDENGVASVLNNIGMLHFKNKDPEAAVKYFLQAVEIQEELHKQSDLSLTYLNIANVKFKQGYMNEALNYAAKSYSIAVALGFPDNISSAAYILKLIYRKQNKYKEAFAMFKVEVEMRDSINNLETAKAAIKKQFQYKYEKQAAADSIKHIELQKIKLAEIEAKQAQVKQEKTQRYALYGGLGLIIVFAGFVFNRLSVARKQKAIIERQKEKVDLAFTSLHEKNKEVMDSINYARRIQSSLLPTEKYISKKLERR